MFVVCFSKFCILFCSDTSYLDALSSIAINLDCQGMHDENRHEEKDHESCFASTCRACL
jgi:hypothetical protein